MAAPSVMIFPNANGESVKRSIILRNISNKDVIVKLVVSCPRSIILEGSNVLVQSKKYAVIPVAYQQKTGPLSPQELGIYMRPIEGHNHEELKKWIKGTSKETTRQLVCKLQIKVDSGYSAFETIIDLPGKASMYETATKAIAGVDDKDTVTCHPIDYDTNTAANIAPADFANAMALEKQEKCWILGPVIDYLFPPTNGETCNNEKEKENNMNPCAGFV